MNLILIILKLLWGWPPHGASQLQLAPVPRRGVASPRERLVTGLWIPGLGWLTFHPLFRRRETADCRLLIYRWLTRCGLFSLERAVDRRKRRVAQKAT